ncbi:MAG: EAL domain-containing protein [Gammaproteobacteria bacterium]|nr:EAL domain-containing protein [Gammaproteobacteria bacterium]
MRFRKLPHLILVALSVMLVPAWADPAPSPTDSEASAGLELTPDERRWLSEHPVIRLGIDPAWEPFEFFDDNGRYRGMASEYIALLSDKLGIEMEPVSGLTWAEVIASAKSGALDVLPCVVETPQRREYLEFTQSYLDFPMVIVTRDDASFISGLDDLAGQRIGVVKGYATVDLIRLNYPNLELVEFTTLEEGLETLSLGRVNAFVDNLATIVTGIKRSNITNIKVAAQTPFSFKLSIGVRKDWPELVGILNKALASITNDQIHQIHDNWIRIKFEHGVDIPFVAKVGLLCAAIVLLVLTVIFIWNRRLLQEVQRRTRAERTLARRNRILEQLSEHQPLEKILEDLVRSVEAEHSDLLCSVLLLDSQGKTFNVVIAPTLPDFYNDAVTGLAIGEGVGSCGHAAFTGERVIAEDIYTHPNWAPFQDLVRRTNLRSCWSEPILSTRGLVLGTFALYYLEPRRPRRLELELIEEIAVQAALAIEHYSSAESLRKLSLAVEHSPNAVLITDRNGVIEYINPRFSEITEYSPAEVLGNTPRMLQADVLPEGHQDELWKAVSAGREWSGEVRNRKKSGALYWTHDLISPIVDGQGNITHFVWLQEDVTEARANNEKLSYQASHDALTGLLNRHEFERRLSHARRTAEQENCEHTLCFLDLDQFKVVNDTAGHVAGDALLKQFAALLKQQLRRQDAIARFGGDEFALLMEHCSVEQARQKAESLRQIVESHNFSWEDQIFSVGVSIGLAPINSASGTPSDILRHADIACYAAKDSGRNRLNVYEPDDELLRMRSGEMLWARRISRALEFGGFTLFVQSVVSLREDDAPPTYEVLLRMTDDDGNLLLPGAFLPSAERFNLINRVDRWVIDEAFAWMKKNQTMIGDRLTLAINLSGQSLGDAELLSHLVDQFRSGVVSGECVTFEITETAAIANLDSAKQFISQLKQYGVTFALDDFGSGLSSFGYLKNLDVDFLKIDGMFVRDLIRNPIDAAMLKSINEIGHVMGKKTIAECVECAEVLERLKKIGVDYAQGYEIQRPFPIGDLLDDSISKAG